MLRTKNTNVAIILSRDIEFSNIPDKVDICSVPLRFCVADFPRIRLRCVGLAKRKHLFYFLFWEGGSVILSRFYSTTSTDFLHLVLCVG